MRKPWKKVQAVPARATVISSSRIVEIIGVMPFFMVNILVQPLYKLGLRQKDYFLLGKNRADYDENWGFPAASRKDNFFLGKSGRIIIRD
jgi:hypothetical protein